MAKILFNDTNYNIDDASLASATDSLKSHLSTVMNGSGATINIGGTEYSVDSTKLSVLKDEFVSHLSLISGNGANVVVGGVSYSVDSTKIQGTISEFEAVLSNLILPAKNISLEVKKITSNTYASNKTYQSEEFILLDVYPKTNGTVSVTYGDATKTITDTSGDAEPTAQKVFFGTFNGVSDQVATPERGTLVIEGDYRCIGVGSYNTAKNKTSYCGCVTAINDFGYMTSIPSNAFNNCTELTNVTIPDSVTRIEPKAFYKCPLNSVSFENTVGWYTTLTSTDTSGTHADVTDPVANATMLTGTTAIAYLLRS